MKKGEATETHSILHFALYVDKFSFIKFENLEQKLDARFVCRLSEKYKKIFSL